MDFLEEFYHLKTQTFLSADIIKQTAESTAHRELLFLSPQQVKAFALCVFIYHHAA